MRFAESLIKGVYLISMEPISDSRGWFSRSFCKEEFKQIGFEKEWVQMNQSYTARRGSIRGMHYQIPPYSEVKMVRAIRGKVMDVIVDVRKGSATFLKYVAVELSAENKQAVLIPEGCAHGFQTLEDDCELIYAHTAFFVKGSEGGLRYNDPAIGVKWPLAPTEISARDLEHPLVENDFQGLSLR